MPPGYLHTVGGPPVLRRKCGLKFMPAVRNVIRSATLRMPPIRRMYETMQLAIDEANTARTRIGELEIRISNAMAERNSAAAGRDAAVTERNAAVAERNAAVAERNAAVVEINKAATERNAAVMEKNAAVAERNAAVMEKNAAVAERNAMAAEVNAAHAKETDDLKVLLEAAERERDLLAAQLEEARARATYAETKISEGIGAALAEVKRLGARFANLTSALSIPAATHSDNTAGVRLYLDLLEAALTGVLIEDPSMAPWTENSFDPIRREMGTDWPARAQTMIGTARMRNLRILCGRALSEGIPGDFIETGAWRGGACILMRGILQAYGEPKRRVFVADSFRGLPVPNVSEYSADESDPHHTYEQLAVSRKEVEENFRRYGLLDDRVVFLEGWFKDTLPDAPIDRLAVLRLDGDMYESTIQALDALYNKVSPGGFVIIDDYILTRCAEAVNYFRETRGITAPMKDVDGAAVWWQVPI
jgi:O-methyltransferase